MTTNGRTINEAYPQRRPAPRAAVPSTPPAAAESSEPAAESSEPAPAPPQVAPAYPARAVTLHLTYHGVPVDLYRADLAIETIEQLVDQITRREGWAAAGDKSFPTLPDGTPICPRHGVPMKLREKQGDSWWSHNVAGEGEEPCYCRGYPGKTSPGWDR